MPAGQRTLAGRVDFKVKRIYLKTALLTSWAKFERRLSRKRSTSQRQRGRKEVGRSGGGGGGGNISSTSAASAKVLKSLDDGAVTSSLPRIRRNGRKAKPRAHTLYNVEPDELRKMDAWQQLKIFQQSLSLESPSPTHSAEEEAGN